MKRFAICIIGINLIIISITIPKISSEKKEYQKIPYTIQKEQEKKKEEKEEPIGEVMIPKIHLKQDLYAKDSIENTIEKHVSILKESTNPEEESSLMVLAAHSGTGDIAYFEELDQLEVKDEVILRYQNIEYHYEVVDIWEEKKNGYIHINRETKKQLILTTCSPKRNGYQLIINTTEKES